MRKKSGKLFMGFLCIMAFVLAGCVRMEESIVVDESNKITMGTELAFQKDKTVELAAQEFEMSQEETEAMLSEDYDIKTIQGVDYYVQQESTELTMEEVEETYPTYLITKDKFYNYISVDEDSETAEEEDLLSTMEQMGMTAEDIEYYVTRVTLPSEIVKTNGTVLEDQKTVQWDLKDAMLAEEEIEIYAYTANDPGDTTADRKTIEDRLDDSFAGYHPGIESPSPSVVPSASPNVSPSAVPNNNAAPSLTPTQTVEPNQEKITDKKAPVIKGVKKNKKYKNKATIYVKDNVKIKKVLINGKKVKMKKVSKGKYKGYYKFTVKKKGKCTVAAYDTSGNCKKIKFRIQ